MGREKTIVTKRGSIDTGMAALEDEPPNISHLLSPIGSLDHNGDLKPEYLTDGLYLDAYNAKKLDVRPKSSLSDRFIDMKLRDEGYVYGDLKPHELIAKKTLLRKSFLENEENVTVYFYKNKKSFLFSLSDDIKILTMVGEVYTTFDSLDHYQRALGGNLYKKNGKIVYEIRPDNPKIISMFFPTTEFYKDLEKENPRF